MGTSDQGLRRESGLMALAIQTLVPIDHCSLSLNNWPEPMLLTLDEEQRLIASSVDELLQQEYSFQQRKLSINTKKGINETVWKQFAKMGWSGISLSEQSGGLGLGLLASGLLMHGLGKYLVVEPIWSCTMLAAPLLEHCAPERVSLLASLAAGTTRAALAYRRVTAAEASSPSFLAVKTSSGYTLNGRLDLCPGAAAADFLLVPVGIDEHGTAHTGLFLIDTTTPGLEIHPVRMLDGAQAGQVRLQDVVVSGEHLLNEEPDLLRKLSDAIARSMILLSWEACGSMTAAFEQTCAYVGLRKQFGKAINEFQVVQHRLAEMSVLCREARAVCELGTVKAQACVDGTVLCEIASMVKAKVSRCAQTIAKDCVQLHGAMGVSEELPIASHFRKLLWFQQIWASAEQLDQQTGETRLQSGSSSHSTVLPILSSIHPADPSILTQNRNKTIMDT